MSDTLEYIFEIDNAYHKVCAILFNTNKTAVNIEIESNKILSHEYLNNISEKIKQKHNFSRVTLMPKYIDVKVDMEYIEAFKAKISKEFPSISSNINSSTWQILDNEIHVKIQHTPHLDAALKNLQNILPIPLNIEFLEMEKDNNREETLKNAIEKASINQSTAIKKPTKKPTTKSTENKYKKQIPLDIKKDDDIIWGKPIKSEITNIDSLNLEIGKVSVIGEVFFVDFRPIPAKNLMIINFDITDKKGSVRVTKMMEIDKAEPFLSNIKKGIYILVQGNMTYNNFEKEMVITPTSIVKTKKIIRQDNAEKKRVELHLHTIMSSMDATNSITQLANRAKEWGHTALAITDHGVAQSFPDAMLASEKLGIKIIYGVEAYIIDNSEILDNTKKRVKTRHQIIIAKNMIGLKNLYKLVSLSHLEYYRGRAIIPRDILINHREGIILGSACEAGELYNAVINNMPDEELEIIAKFNDYLEIQPVMNNEFMIKKGIVSNLEEIRDFNRKIVKLGEKLNIPVVATGDVHFLEPEDEMFRRVLMAGKGFSDADNQPPLYFKTTDEMLEEFSYLGKEKAYEVVVTNTNLISDMCENIRPIPKETYTPKIKGSAKELEKISRDMAHKLYGKILPETVSNRLERELKSIIGNGFDVMYIIAQKLVSKSILEGYLVGSRGSVGSSFVAFLAGITEVNSLEPHYRCTKCEYSDFKYSKGKSYGAGADMPDKNCPDCGENLLKDGFDIPFETFLGFDGDKAPDIDLNFSGEYQAKAHKHTIEIFGEDHVFRAGTIGTIAEKTAYGYVRKYLDERGQVKSKAEQNRLTVGCTGVKRTTGQHPGGLMIVPFDNSIYEFCPVQRPADDITSDIITTHFDYHSIHDNLLKLDLLGHDDPTIIKILEDLTGENAQNIKLDDADTMSLFTSIEKLGIKNDKILGTTGAIAIPEFGTKFVRSMLADTKPTTFDELVRISGLSHGTDVWVGNSQDLVKNKTATLKEIICARDDIMNYLIEKGVEPKLSFNIMENVRKGKGLKPEWVEIMTENNVPNWYIESCEKIKYMFPKAHAVAYVMMAFRIAWFKVHHPLAFYSAYFTIRAKAFDANFMVLGKDIVIQKMQEFSKQEKLTAVEKDMQTTLEVCYEFYTRGYEFANIDVYKSDVTKFLIKDGKLLPPLTSMPGIGDTAAKSIALQRKSGKFLSVDEMISRCEKVSISVTDTLDSIGALGDMPKTAQVTFF